MPILARFSSRLLSPPVVGSLIEASGLYIEEICRAAQVPFGGHSRVRVPWRSGKTAARHGAIAVLV